MLNLLENIWSFIQSIIAFIVHLLDFLFDAISFIPNALTTLFESIAYLPGVLIGFATLYVVFLVVNYIIVRN